MGKQKPSLGLWKEEIERTPASVRKEAGAANLQSFDEGSKPEKNESDHQN
jgi:hypothetical protein